MNLGVRTHQAMAGAQRIELRLGDGTLLRGSRIRITHTWRAPSGVLVQSCVPRGPERRNLLAVWSYVWRRYVRGIERP